MRFYTTIWRTGDAVPKVKRERLRGSRSALQSIWGSSPPLSNDEMAESCQINHGMSFQLTEKIDVNGAHTHPLFIYLKGKLSTWWGRKIRWDFEKFIIDQNGNLIKRFASLKKMEKYIVNILVQSESLYISSELPTLLLFLVSILLTILWFREKPKKPKDFSRISSPKWRNILVRHIHFFNGLPADEKIRFEQDIQDFLESFKVTGIST
jgi:hypothetical protein